MAILEYEDLPFEDTNNHAYHIGKYILEIQHDEPMRCF